MAAARAAESANLAAESAATAATTGGRHASLPGMHEMYHLDAASLGGFEEAAASATRALESLLARVGSDGHTQGINGRLSAVAGGLLPPTGVASLLIGADGGSGGVEGRHAAGDIAVAIAGVRDSFRALVVAAAALGVVVPCAQEGAGAIYVSHFSGALAGI